MEKTQLIDRKISVVGLGYVGLPLTIAFSKKAPVIAFDISSQRIRELKTGFDSTGELNPGQLDNPNITYTNNPADLKKSDFIIVAPSIWLALRHAPPRFICPCHRCRVPPARYCHRSQPLRSGYRFAQRIAASHVTTLQKMSRQEKGQQWLPASQR